MVELTELSNIVRKGIVQSVDTDRMRARVKFGDKGGINSGDLFILVTKERVIVKTEQGHIHEAYLEQWVPDIGSMVLCLMMPGGDGEGYILGGIK